MVTKTILINCFALILLITPLTKGITANQTDDFENGTTQGWISGFQNPNPPANISSGGPLGTDDNYLRITSTGGFGAGGKLVAFNASQWKGNYINKNIVAISADVKNFGTTNLTLRLALDGPGGYVNSISGINLSTGSDWQNITFPVTSSDLTGGSVNATLANVTEVRLLHSTTPDYKGDPIVATLGVDNILSFTDTPQLPPPDISWTFSSVADPNNSNLFGYQLTEVNPPETNLGVIGSINPTIPLVVGKRYAVTIADPLLHPFEVIAKGNTDNEDTPLLSQGFEVSLYENDPNVAWQDESGTITFTLTNELADAMSNSTANQIPGYRCRIHSFSERGNFTISQPPIDQLIGLSPISMNLETVASGLISPVRLVPDPTELDRLYIVDQSGPVYIIENGKLMDQYLMDVNNLLVNPLGIIGSHDANDFDERGFLGMAFHPDFTEPNLPGYNRLYTYTSEPVDGTADFTIDLPIDQVNHQSVIREWQIDPNTGLVDPNSSRVIIRIDEPQFNHNAGHLEFGPDGYLYIAVGDGGGANDTSSGHGPKGNGQNINTVHGSIMRIDPVEPVLTPDKTDPVSTNGAYRVPIENPFVGIEGIDEIYAYGFRNPYQFSFDMESGNLIAADVGQNQVEEIDIVNKGHNYGWNLKEGSFKFDPNNMNIGLPLDDPNLTDPVAEYDHDDGISIIGGYSYYGNEIPELWGSYVFGDFSKGFFAPSGRIFTADLFTGEIHELLIGPEKKSLGLFIKGMGQDNYGDVYILASAALGPYGDKGEVLKIINPQPKFAAELSSVDAGTTSTATGEASFALSQDGNSVSFKLTIEGLQNITQAHIHIASIPGGNGSPAVWLYPSTPPAVLIPGEFNGILAESTFTEANFIGPLAGMSMKDLLTAISENRAYVNVHTSEFPAGAIRGSITRVFAQPPIIAILSGDSAGNDSEAIGQAILKISPDVNSISYKLEVLDIENVTQAHIHIASVAGGNGSPAVWLYPSMPPATIIPGKFNGILGMGTFSADDFIGPLAGMTLDDLLVAIQENRAYVNIHTQQFPAGEIRGQLK